MCYLLCKKRKKKKRTKRTKCYERLSGRALFSLSDKNATDAVIRHISLQSGHRARARHYSESLLKTAIQKRVEVTICNGNPKLPCTAVVLKRLNGEIPAILSREMTATRDANGRHRCGSARGNVGAPRCMRVRGYTRYI